MKEKGKCIEIRTNDDKLIFKLFVYDMEIYTDNTTENSSHNGNGRAKTNGKNSNNGTLMTDKQKKYLFRLLADQEIEEDDALEELKTRLKVNNLKNATKENAGNLIKELIAENNGGE